MSRAHELMKEASARVRAAKRNLSEVLGEIPEIAQNMSAAELRDLETPEHYLGAAEEFRKGLLDSAKKEQPLRSKRKPGRRQSKSRNKGRKKR